MKYLFTILLVTTLFTAKAQTPLAEVFHGCGGATITASAGDLRWGNVTYEFQKQTGITWTTMLTSTTNWFIILTGDVTVPTTYRVNLRNNITLEERLTNGVTVDPARFPTVVPTPRLFITPNWGAPTTPVQHFFLAEVSGFNSVIRPPFRFEYRKATELTFLNKNASTGTFIDFIEPNEEYDIRVTDFCGNTTPIQRVAVFSNPVVSIVSNTCSGATISLGVTGSNGITRRGPFTFALSRVPAGTTIPIPANILSTLSYTYPEGNATNIPAGLYVVRGSDAFGALTTASLLNVPGVLTAAPSFTSFGTPYCNINIALATPSSPFGPFTAGIRLKNSTQPFTFSTDLSISNIKANTLFEVVVKDNCGNVSPPADFEFPLVPLINTVFPPSGGCTGNVIVFSTTCTGNAEYRLQLGNAAPGNWQSSSTFTNVPITGCFTVYVRDGNSPVASRTICNQPLELSLTSGPINSSCGSAYEISASAAYGGAPYTYAISYDGVNFSAPNTNNFFNPLLPGTYKVKVMDACGQSVLSNDIDGVAGDLYQVLDKGFLAGCVSNTDTAGGYLRIGLTLNPNAQTVSAPYYYQVKEVIGKQGNTIQYGPVVKSGEALSPEFTISGLAADKHYGVFIFNNCNEAFTAKDRLANDYAIPAGTLPQPVITINSNNCSAPFFEFNNLPSGGVVEVFKGKGTTGTAIGMASATQSNVVNGGYHTIRISSANLSGCYWSQLYERYVLTDDSTTTGIRNLSIGNICKAVDTVVNIADFIIGLSPGGTWSATPAITWVSQDSGLFIPLQQAEGDYVFEYTVTSLCGTVKNDFLNIPITLPECGLSISAVDVESAGSPVGCQNYTGNNWYDVLDAEGKLRYSINPGTGNNILGTCWGARFAYSGFNPRTTTINNSPVYFADRNFYIEPNSASIGVNPVRIRLYYSNDEIERLVNYLRSNGFPAADINSLRILKKSAGQRSPVNLDVAFDGGNASSLYTVITPIVMPFGSGGNLWYFEFEVTGFSEVALAFPSGIVVLPVTGLSVSGNVVNGQSHIQWSTLTETNTRSFTLEHGTNGRQFTDVQTIPAAGNSNRLLSYAAIHVNPSIGDNYYRIKQTDIDGRASFSKTIVLNNNQLAKTIRIAPNPATDRLNVWLSEAAGGNVSLRIFNNLGQVVEQRQVGIGTTNFSININRYAPGYYRLQVLQAGKVQTLPFIKK